MGTLRRSAVLASAALALLLPACSTVDGEGGGEGGVAAAPSSAEVSSTGSATGVAHRPAHVVIAVFENKGVGALRAAPFLAGLAARGTAFVDAHGVAHPSQPNYLALFSGSTRGVTDDACPLSSAGDNLAAQLHVVGLSFTGYAEGLPEPGWNGCTSGRYARKHSPWFDFPALPATVGQPLSALPADFGQLPTVAFVVPDLCHDMHDCSVSTGDEWARQHLDRYASWATAHDSLLIVTFDEDEGTSVNTIPTFVVGAGVPTGTSRQRIDHYSVLRTVEDLYGLPPLGGAAAAAPLAGIGR